MADVEDGFMGEVIGPDEQPTEPPMCSDCCRDVGGELVRVGHDGKLRCAGCDPSVPEE